MLDLMGTLALCICALSVNICMTLNACERVTVVCLCVCLSEWDNLLCSLTPAYYSAYHLYYYDEINAKFLTSEFR